MCMEINGYIIIIVIIERSQIIYVMLNYLNWLRLYEILQEYKKLVLLIFGDEYSYKNLESL